MNSKQQKLYNKYANKSYLAKKKLSTYEVVNGIVLPAKKDERMDAKLWAIGGVIDESGNFIEESSSGYLFGGNYEYNENFVDISEEEVVFMGPFIKHWGHFICDQISRLWYVIDDPSKYKIAYCGWNWNQGLSDISGNYLELFELLGIKREQLINVQKPTKFKKIIIPEFSFIPQKYYTKEFLDMIKKIVNNNKINISNCPKNVYFTRILFGNSSNKERGELQIVEYLKKKNFAIVSPEKLSLKEQIFYLNHCENICMISGSISHNLMFSTSNNHMIILNKTDMINGYQMIIDHITKSNIIYIDVYRKILKVLFGMGPFLMSVNHYLQDWGGKISIEKKNSNLQDYIWYFKTYRFIYKNDNNRRLLKSQNSSLKKKNI